MTVFTPTTEDTRIYECAVLLPTTLSDKELKETLKNFEAYFAEKNAKLLHKDEWGKRGLAYKIKGHAEGLYIVYHYEFKPADVKEIDAALTLEKHILRHLLIRVPDGYEVVDYSKKFAEWLREREKEDEEEKKQREEELKKKIVKRATKKAATPDTKTAKTPERKEVEAEGKLEEKLEELISDEDLNL